MGQYRIEIVAVGGHGCQREKKDQEVVYGCGHMDCPDCLTAKFVADLYRANNSIEKATLTHWPGTESEVVDNFVSPEHHQTRIKRIRKGSF